MLDDFVFVFFKRSEENQASIATCVLKSDCSLHPPSHVSNHLKPPSRAPTANKLMILIRDGNGEYTGFQITQNTKMRKVFDAYAKRKGISPSSLYYTLDGERVGDDDTPKRLELENNDTVHAVLEQVGC